ncbi:MAG: hypothetical protein RR054_00450 [Clostridia bacterium]
MQKVYLTAIIKEDKTLLVKRKNSKSGWGFIGVLGNNESPAVLLIKTLESDFGIYALMGSAICKNEFVYKDNKAELVFYISEYLYGDEKSDEYFMQWTPIDKLEEIEIRKEHKIFIKPLMDSRNIKDKKVRKNVIAIYANNIALDNKTTSYQNNNYTNKKYADKKYAGKNNYKYSDYNKTINSNEMENKENESDNNKYKEKSSNSLAKGYIKKSKKIYSLESVLEFGKYRGVKIKEIAITDGKYLTWAEENLKNFKVDEQVHNLINKKQ